MGCVLVPKVPSVDSLSVSCVTRFEWPVTFLPPGLEVLPSEPLFKGDGSWNAGFWKQCAQSQVLNLSYVLSRDLTEGSKFSVCGLFCTLGMISVLQNQEDRHMISRISSHNIWISQ